MEPTTFIKRQAPATVPDDAIKNPWVCASCGYIGETSRGGFVNIRGYLYCDNGDCNITAMSGNPCRGCGK